MENSHKRTGGLLMKSLSSHPDYYRQKTRWEKQLGRKLENDEFEREYWEMPEGGAVNSGTSIFDPVLCELAYTWFTAPNAEILDPFAGGSVRGVVAAYLGRSYTGIDLRVEQIEENIQQATRIVPDNMPTWIVGDSRQSIPERMFDFVFSCPPYFDLEV